MPEQITGEMTGDQTVTAAWMPITYSIAYAANGGSGTMAQTSATYDSTVTIATNAFVYEGYLFKGWATTADGEVVYTGGETVSNLTTVQNGVVTLYAIWEEDSSAPIEPEDPTFTPPSWDSAENYQNNMVVYAQVKDISTETLVEAEGSLLAAFDADGVCRGSVAIANGPKGKLYQLTIKSNTFSGETLSLKVWNAATGETITLRDTVVFESDGFVGSLLIPVMYTVGLSALDMTLVPGWNWISVNLKFAEEVTLSEIFKDWTPCNEDIVKSASETATYYDGTWWPEDFKLEPGKMYQVKSSASAVANITLEGEPASLDDAIDVTAGWNWIGYTGSTAVEIASAFTHDTVFSNEDLLKSGTSSATYYDGEWWGDLMLEPGKGYKLKAASATTLQYADVAPLTSAALMSMATPMAVASNCPSWEQAVHQYNMTVYAVIQDDAGNAFEAEGSLLAAFDANGVCRGVQKIATGPRGKLYQITPGADVTTGETFTLKLWDAASGTIYDIVETVAFTADGKIGSIINPQVYTVVETEVKYPVVVKVIGEGSVAGEASYAAGEEVDLSATADEDNLFCGWSTTPVTMTAAYTFTMPEEAVT
ncbi:MAG: InlB B-repeat-containing protein, partial [Kiritimatiellae bacterium]|nr:InlB B-repeat-containing protein [Kiritimatiellia bacterium]